MFDFMAMFGKKSYEDRSSEAKEKVNDYVRANKINKSEGNSLYVKYLALLRKESSLEIDELVESYLRNRN
jgi:hypothetical protein